MINADVYLPLSIDEATFAILGPFPMTTNSTWKIEEEGMEIPSWPAGKYNATMIAEWFEGEFLSKFLR